MVDDDEQSTIGDEMAESRRNVDEQARLDECAVMRDELRPSGL